MTQQSAEVSIESRRPLSQVAVKCKMPKAKLKFPPPCKCCVLTIIYMQFCCIFSVKPLYRCLYRCPRTYVVSHATRQRKKAREIRRWHCLSGRQFMLPVKYSSTHVLGGLPKSGGRETCAPLPFTWSQHSHADDGPPGERQRCRLCVVLCWGCLLVSHLSCLL